MSVALSVYLQAHMQVLSWSGLAILAPVIVIGGIRRVRPRSKRALRGNAGGDARRTRIGHLGK